MCGILRHGVISKMEMLLLCNILYMNAIILYIYKSENPFDVRSYVGWGKAHQDILKELSTSSNMIQIRHGHITNNKNHISFTSICKYDQILSLSIARIKTSGQHHVSLYIRCMRLDVDLVSNDIYVGLMGEIVWLWFRFSIKMKLLSHMYF